MAKKSTGIKFDPDQREKLSAMAEGTEHTVADLVRLAVDKLFAEVESTGKLSFPYKSRQTEEAKKKASG